MLSRVQIFFLFSLVLLLSSCAVIDDRPPEKLDAESILETNVFSGWQLSYSEERMAYSNRAVGQLLNQADDLMSAANFEQAADKLERLVRIEPKFAQAWSRLSWIALKKGDAQRSHQLAQRSNSYSRDNKQLKLLNWHFIKKAGELLDNINIIQQAQRMLRTLSDE